MTSGSMRAWLQPTLGALLFVAGAAGIAYKVIGSYRHAAPDAFVSVQDERKLAAAAPQGTTAAAPAAAVQVATASPSAATQNSTSPAPVAPAPAAPTPPAPARASRDALQSASSAADSDADAQNDAACLAIKTEQHEIEGALKKQYSSEEGRYLQRRLRELTEQSVKNKCGE